MRAAVVCLLLCGGYAQLAPQLERWDAEVRHLTAIVEEAPIPALQDFERTPASSGTAESVVEMDLEMLAKAVSPEDHLNALDQQLQSTTSAAAVREAHVQALSAATAAHAASTGHLERRGLVNDVAHSTAAVPSQPAVNAALQKKMPLMQLPSASRAATVSQARTTGKLDDIEAFASLAYGYGEHHTVWLTPKPAITLAKFERSERATTPVACAFKPEQPSKLFSPLSPYINISPDNKHHLDLTLDKSNSFVVDPVLPSEKLLGKAQYTFSSPGFRILHNTYIKSTGEGRAEAYYGADNLALPPEESAPACVPKLCYGVLLWPGNYYHWMANNLPRLLMCSKADFNTVLVNRNMGMTKFIGASLQRFNPPLDILHQKQIAQRSVLVGQLGMPFLPDEYNNIDYKNPEMKHFHVHRVTPFAVKEVPRLFGIHQGSAPTRLIRIMRKGDREVQDDDGQVNQWLKKQGFEVVYLEKFPAKEQMEMMRDAKVVVATHGAGMVNCMTMQKGSTMVEMCPTNYYKPAGAGPTKVHYHVMAKMLGTKYDFIPLESDYSIDFKNFQCKMQQVLNIPKTSC